MAKRKKTRGSIEQLKTGKWRVAIMVNGRRTSKTFATKAQAEEWRRDRAESIAVGIPAGGETFGSVVQLWLAHIKANKDERTHRAYSDAMKPYEGLYNVQTDRVRPLHLQAVLDSLPPRRATQMTHDKMRQCLRWAVRMQLLPHNPSDGVERPKHERRKIEVFTMEQAHTILEASKRLRMRAAIRIGLCIGLRGGEIWGLQWADFNGTNLTIDRQAVENKKGVEMKPPKKHSYRTIPLPDSVVEALEERKREQMREGHAASPLMFPNTLGNINRRTTFSRCVWKPLLKRCNIPHRGFHHCRHTFATLALNAGVPVTVVSGVLGHKDPATTLSIYAHLMTSEMDQHRNRLDDAMRQRRIG